MQVAGEAALREQGLGGLDDDGSGSVVDVSPRGF